MKNHKFYEKAEKMTCFYVFLKLSTQWHGAYMPGLLILKILFVLIYGKYIILLTYELEWNAILVGKCSLFQNHQFFTSLYWADNFVKYLQDNWHI